MIPRALAILIIDTMITMAKAIMATMAMATAMATATEKDMDIIIIIITTIIPMDTTKLIQKMGNTNIRKIMSRSLKNLTITMTINIMEARQKNTQGQSQPIPLLENQSRQ